MLSGKGLLYSGHANAQLESKTGVERKQYVNVTELHNFHYWWM